MKGDRLSDGKEDSKANGELLLVRQLLSGSNEAWSDFVRRHSDLVYSFCALVFPEPDLEEEYLHIFKAIRSDDFALLRGFDGRSKLSTYLTLKVADLLSGRILQLFRENRDLAWTAFERFFKRDIMRIVSRHSSPFSHQGHRQNGSAHEDLYQEICLFLVDQGYQRILSYDGRGSFSGYMRRVVENLCRDVIRKTDGRRRMPERIQRLSLLDQEIFRKVHWEGRSRQELFEGLRDETGKPLSQQRVEEALARVETALSAKRFSGKAMLASDLAISFNSKGQTWRKKETLGYHSAEAAFVEAEERGAEEKVIQILQEALSLLPVEERLYVEHRFYADPPASPREIARLMGRSEQEIYKIRKQVISSLRSMLKAKGIDKFHLPVRLEEWGGLL